MIRFLILLAAALAMAGCHKESDQADAFGTFEVTEVTVSAETSGRILRFDVREGTSIAAGTPLALVDTTLFFLQMREIDAAMKSVRSRLTPVEAQNAVLSQQIANLDVDISRIANMLKEDAATQKQYDDLTGQVAVLRRQMAANNTQKGPISAELAVLEAKKATLGEQIRRSSILAPLAGTILEKYAEAGEMTAAGRPLVKIADLSVVRLKVYVSGAQLGNLQTGASCTVRIDGGEKGYRSFPEPSATSPIRRNLPPRSFRPKRNGSPWSMP